MLCWVLCILPCLFVMLFGTNIILTILPLPEGDGMSLAKLVIASYQGAVEVLSSLIVTLAMFKGFKDWMRL